jgi:hypothetical protein
MKEQKEFEKSLFSKTSKGSGDVILLDNWTIVYRNNVDLLFYVMGSTNENEVDTHDRENQSIEIDAIDLVNVKCCFNVRIRFIEYNVA